MLRLYEWMAELLGGGGHAITTEPRSAESSCAWGMGLIHLQERLTHSNAQSNLERRHLKSRRTVWSAKLTKNEMIFLQILSQLDTQTRPASARVFGGRVAPVRD